ncbi:MAG: PTS galactitol transporter subunit IIC [Tractidigestivibacter sp.]|jgi:PTS system galactitol-specific IIC component|uniref:PTS galactitol transporter subunit IIC n=1 Tax=Tractidigestivibacter sp. TaxID=2847320 RepID=UPI003D8AC949
MDAFINGLYTVFQALINAGAYVMLPIIITILGLIFRLSPGKAFKSGITITCGFVGINLLVNLLKSAVTPAASAMVENFGLNLDVTDVGWGAISSITWASPIVALLVFEILGLNILLLVLKKTTTMDVDIWNYHHMMIAGILVFFVTGNIVWALVATAFTAIMTFKFSDWTKPLVSHFFGIPDVSLPTISYTSSIIIAAPLNWLIDRIPGLRDVNFSIKNVQKYLGIFGDPMMLGFILGCAMGALALMPIDQIFLTGVNVAAVMVLMPKMTAMFVEGLMPISQAAQKFTSDKFGGQALSIGLDAAVVVGNPEVITTALIMIPITILLAFILPGNRMMPLADLAVVTFRVALVVALCRGNVFRSILISIPVMAAILYGGTFAAPYLTAYATSTGLTFDGLIASMAGPSLTQTAIVFWSCISQYAIVIVPVLFICFLGVWYLIEKKIGMDKIEAYAAKCDEQ